MYAFLDVKIVTNIMANIFLERNLLHLGCVLKLKVIQHFLKRSSVDRVSDAKPSIFLFLLGNNIKIRFVCMLDEPIGINYTVKNQDEYTSHQKEQGIAKPI